MKFYTTALFLALGLVPALAQAGLVCESQEIDTATNQGASIDMAEKTTRRPNTKKWERKTSTFVYSVTALGTEGNEDIYPQIALRTTPLTFASVAAYKAKSNEGDFQISLTVGTKQGAINCFRE